MNSRKIYISRIAYLLLIICICTIYLSLFQVRFDQNNVRVEGFYKEPKNTLDVIVLGASETYSGYSPTYAYNNYKYTSYTFAIEDNPVVLYPSEINEILAHQKPKYIIIEVSGATSRRTPTDAYFDATLRKYTDSIHLSDNKIKTVDAFAKIDDKSSYYIPFIMYHGVKPSIKTAVNIIMSKFTKFTFLKGAATHTKSKRIEGEILDVEHDDTKQVPSESAIESLSSLLEYCKNVKETKFIFTRFPHRITDKNNLYDGYLQGNYIADYIRNNGFEFVDLQSVTNDMHIDFKKDFTDDNHLNGFGQRKLTDYIGKLLGEKYKLSSTELSAKSEADWKECVDYMEKYYTYFEREYNNTYSEDDFISELPEYIIKINSIN